MPVVGDTAVEPTETFQVVLSAPAGATIADGNATGTISNDDSMSVPALSINDATVVGQQRNDATDVHGHPVGGAGRLDGDGRLRYR